MGSAAPPAGPPAMGGGEWHFPAAGGSVDEHEVFTSWLRGEFAAANAMIDLLLGHLRAVDGNAADYDAVYAAVSQRRLHWGPILHLQQFFPIGAVEMALQQTAWRRRSNPPPRRQSGYEYWRAKNGSGSKENSSSNGCSAVAVANRCNNTAENGHSEPQSGGPAYCTDESRPAFTPTEFSYCEMVDMKMVNVFEGLKLYEDLVEMSDVTKLLSWANEARITAREGDLEDISFVMHRRPMKGHGREIIQLGHQIISSTAEDDINYAHCRAQKVEPIPDLVCNVFDHLIQQDILFTKPDYCVFDFFDEGDHSHPISWPSWYGTAVATLCLTECEMTFGRRVLSDAKNGFHKGPLKLSLPRGALLLHQGKSLELARRAIPSLRRRRILLTFGKFCKPQSKNLHEGPHSKASLNHPPPSPVDLGFPPASAIVPAQPPTLQPYQAPPNGVQPHIPSTALSAAAAPFPGELPLANNASTAWRMDAPSVPTAAVPPRAASSLPPGTGVFLPSMSSDYSSPSQHGSMVQNGGSTSPRPSPPKLSDDTAAPEPQCNGSSNGDIIDAVEKVVDAYPDHQIGSVAAEEASPGDEPAVNDAK